jgi:hypothetical protein
MPRPLSLDLRSRVLAAVGGGLSCRQASERFGVCASSAFRGGRSGPVRNFVFGRGIVGKKDISHGPTQRAVDT